MIKKLWGNILDAKENITCQQVNCKGVMGAGLAKQIADKYPHVYKCYKEMCDNYKFPFGESLLGKTLFVEINNQEDLFNSKEEYKVIACLFSQGTYGKSNRVYTDYSAFAGSLLLVKQYAEGMGYSVAIPYGIGCGLGNGDWRIIYNIIGDIFGAYDISIYRLR